MNGYTNDLYLSWDDLQMRCITLAHGLLNLKKNFDVLIAVTRGGMSPASIIARELSIHHIDTFCISRYNVKDVVREEIIKLPNDYTGKNVLVIDDLADKGRTLEIVRQYLPQATIATVFVKPHGKKFVDIFVEEVNQDTWVRFPWDTQRIYKAPLTDQIL